MQKHKQRRAMAQANHHPPELPEAGLYRERYMLDGLDGKEGGRHVSWPKKTWQRIYGHGWESRRRLWSHFFFWYFYFYFPKRNNASPQKASKKVRMVRKDWKQEREKKLGNLREHAGRDNYKNDRHGQ